MNKYQFSKNSRQKLNTANEPLITLFSKAIERSPVDFGIARAKASEQEQFELFKKGRQLTNGQWVITNKSKVLTYKDGYNKKSKHQSGNAVDIYAYINGKASWDPLLLSIIAGVILATANDMGIEIKWGGTFGSTVFNGWDKPHFELTE